MLAYNLFKNPKIFWPWNFGTERNTITSVEEVIEKLLNFGVKEI